jgi:hypothetical protein
MSNASDTKDGLRASLRDLVVLHGVAGFEPLPVECLWKRIDPAGNSRLSREGIGASWS